MGCGKRGQYGWYVSARDLVQTGPVRGCLAELKSKQKTHVYGLARIISADSVYEHLNVLTAIENGAQKCR